MNPGASAIRKWRQEPWTMVHDVYDQNGSRVVLDAWQLEAMKAAVAGNRTRRRLAMKACAGPGKSTVLAWLAYWRLLCFGDVGEHPQGSAVSITADNLKANLWKELAKWKRRSSILDAAFEQTAEAIFARQHPKTWRLDFKSFPKSANNDEIGATLSGLHSRFPFFLIDESGGISPQIGKSAEQALSTCEDGLIATAGNPLSLEGLLYEICSRGGKEWEVITITADPDDPNRTPRIDLDWARDQIAKHGREDSWVRIYILGLFPKTALSSLLSLEDVDKAMARGCTEADYRYSQKRLGIDPAREGDDASVFTMRQGILVYPQEVYRGALGDHLAGRSILIQRNWGQDMTFVDCTGGFGGSIVDFRRQTGHATIEVQAAGQADEPMRYVNKRAEMHWRMATAIKSRLCLPNDAELKSELIAPKYWYDPSGRLKIESKEQIKKRLGKSPDKADSLLQTYAVAERLVDPVTTLGPGYGQPYALVPGSSVPREPMGVRDNYDPLAGI